MVKMTELYKLEIHGAFSNGKETGVIIQENGQAIWNKSWMFKKTMELSGLI